MAALIGRRARLADETGAELIEFALVFPLMLLVLLGIIDFGLLFQKYEVVINAAREGARVAVLPGYADADVATRVDQYLTAGGLVDAHDAPTVTHPASLKVGGQCVAVTAVTVTYPHTYSFVGGIAGYFGATGLTSRTLAATAEMRNELSSAGTCG